MFFQWNLLLKHEFLFLPPEVCTVFHRAAVHSKKLIIHSLISTYIKMCILWLMVFIHSTTEKGEKTSEMETETNDSSLEVTSDTGEVPLCCTGVQQKERLARGYSRTPYEQKKEGCSRNGV
ncbi:uncharacterized protein GJ701_009429 isoform 2-T2 [Geothlypis trichas]